MRFEGSFAIAIVAPVLRFFIEEMFFDQKFGKYEININIFSLLNTLGTLM